jgi:hypothetical protein
MRRACVLRHNKGSSGHPDDIIAFDVETRGQPSDDSPKVTVELKYGYAIWDRELWRKGRTETQEDECEFEDADTFWDFVEKHALQKRILWVVGHNAKNFDYSVLEFESSLTARGWTMGSSPILPTDGMGPLKIVAKKDGKTLHLVDLANWYTAVPLDTIGRAVGCHKTEFESEEQKQAVLRSEKGDELWDTLVSYCQQDVEVVRTAMRTWIAFLKEHDLGNFAVSIAGQSMQAFRHRFMKHEIMLHNNPEALALEREAYSGARVDCFRVGAFEGSFHVVDVNSEYAYVMKREKYPTKLVSVKRHPEMRSVLRLLREEWAVIARCIIDTSLSALPPREVAVVPAKHDGKLLYPTGRFQATLCTGELKQALELGIVEAIDSIAVYEQEHVFGEYVDFFYGLRLKYKAEGNTAYDQLAKLFTNSLYGKWGQLNWEWETTTQQLAKAGIEKVYHPETGTTTVVRQMGNLCQVRSRAKVEGRTSFCAIAAHATSYARMTISQLRLDAGINHVLYTDTDSLIVDDEGLAQLEANGVIGPALGQMKIEESAPAVVVTAPKNYRCGTKIRHKGRRKDAKELGDGSGRYRQIQFRNLGGAFRARDPNHAVISYVVKKGDMAYSKGTVGPDGWTSPLHLRM